MVDGGQSGPLPKQSSPKTANFENGPVPKRPIFKTTQVYVTLKVFFSFFLHLDYKIRDFFFFCISFNECF